MLSSFFRSRKTHVFNTHVTELIRCADVLGVSLNQGPGVAFEEWCKMAILCWAMTEKRLFVWFPFQAFLFSNPGVHKFLINWNLSIAYGLSDILNLFMVWHLQNFLQLLETANLGNSGILGGKAIATTHDPHVHLTKSLIVLPLKSLPPFKVNIKTHLGTNQRKKADLEERGSRVIWKASSKHIFLENSKRLWSDGFPSHSPWDMPVFPSYSPRYMPIQLWSKTLVGYFIFI